MPDKNYLKNNPKALTKKPARVSALLLLLCIIFGAVVRFWGIAFGLPYTECRPDELRIVHIAFSFFSGSPHPHFFDYPTCFMYLVFIAYVLYFLGGCVMGQFSGLQDLINQFFINPDAFYLISRGMSALFGTATIPVVYFITKRIFGKRSALFASGLMSIAYLHVRDSHFGVTDVPMTFFIMMAVLYILKSRCSKTTTAYVAAGIFTGLAAATKYSGIFLIAPMGLAYVFTLHEEKKLCLRTLLDRRICAFALGAFAAFFITSPFIILDFKSFLPAFTREMDHLKHGHWGIMLGRGWWYHLRYTLMYGVGPPILFSALASFTAASRRNWQLFCVTAAFPLLYYAVSGRGYTVFLRYMIPVVPFLCVFAAGFAVACADKISLRLAEPVKSLLLVGFLIAFAWYPAQNTFQCISLLSESDNRVIAAEWIEANIPPGSTIYQCFWPSLTLEAPQAAVTIYPPGEKLETSFKRRVARGREHSILEAKREYIKQHNRAGFHEWHYDNDRDVFTSDNIVQRGIPDYIITITSPLTWLSFPPPGIVQRYLDTSYVLLKSFIAFDMSEASAAWFDQIDAFYLPFKGFDGTIRPGPNIFIFKKLRGQDSPKKDM